MTDKLNDIKEQWKQHGEEVGVAESVNGVFYTMQSRDVKDVDWLISEIEAQSDALKWAKGEIDEMEAEIEQLKADINIMENEYMHGLKYENKRLREVLKWIVGHSIDYQAISKARRALKGGRNDER
jgi:prophage DNA circulation protein